MDARFRFFFFTGSRPQNIIRITAAAVLLLLLLILLKILVPRTLLLIMLLLCSQYLDSMLVLLREVFLMPIEEVLRAGQSSLQLAHTHTSIHRHRNIYTYIRKYNAMRIYTYCAVCAAGRHAVNLARDPT